MIERGNFAEALRIMGFTANESESIFTYEHDGFTMSADFSSGTLIYPTQIRGRERNTSFNAPENFVVFECVYRLLRKGYRPEDIELGKEWRLGHVPKGGRADICVYERDSENVLMIIECKTSGREYYKAFNDTKNDGGQLFSYWQQEVSAKWLALYTSDLEGGKITYKDPAVNCSDDENLLKRPGHDETLRLFRDAHTVQEKFRAWQETYYGEFSEGIIFSEDSAAYDIGRKPLRKKNLQPLTEETRKGIINAFEEILRHNNVSDKENAFNRLVALFICKLADESGKSDDEELAFQYIPRRDTYEDLQNRLQLLYHDGMYDFMREDITYIPADYPALFMSQYKGGDRAKAIQELADTFRRLKYFTNNDFAFLDVHNEELFYKNGKILVEVVQLFERFRIVHTEKHQLLGDLFEQLLDQGFRQNEGQFFTPIPLARFIWDSLPLRRFESWPRIIDYACGAGHFLTEAIEAVNYFLPSDTNEWTYDYVYGVEKDYRLARVSKVSMFMNGAGGSNIIFGDGLENGNGITPGAFDILTANPPYSVASFKQHLRFTHKDFRLWDKISAGSSEIEVLFVERIGQLLNDKGLAAVILPSSILSNDSASYTGAREEILRTFKLRAIVKLGSRTFGATGTNTVILFMERYYHHPPRTCHVEDSVDAIFDRHKRPLELWEDIDILTGYLDMQGLTREQWHDFVHEVLDPETMPEYFRMYFDAFGAENFYDRAKAVEREKVFCYGLTYKQKTTVILAPSDNAGQREFLGYYWSGRKGDEGIHYDGERGGKMYVDSGREAVGTLADVVRQSFGDGDIVMTEDNRRYARVVETWRMLDFSRVYFNAAINLQPEIKIELESKYNMTEIGKVLTLEYGKGLPASQRTPGKYPVLGSNGRIGTHNKFWVKGPVIVIGRTGSAGAVTWEDEDCYPIDTTYHVKLKGDNVLLRYVYYVFQHMDFSVLNSKMGVPCINRDDVYKRKIPLPPMEIQREIVRECAQIDMQESSLNAGIKSRREKIDDIFSSLEALPGISRFALDDKKAFTLAIGKRVLNSELIPGGNIPVYSANVREPFGYVNELLKGFEDFGSDSVLWGIDGDFMVSFMEHGREFYPTDHCGVLRVITDRIHPRYMARVLEREGTRLGFSRNFRASLDRVGGIKFSVPDIVAQNEAMKEVLRLEGEILRAMNELEGLKGMKEATLNKYLR